MKKNLECLIIEHSKAILEYAKDDISSYTLQYFYNLWKTGRKANRTSFVLYLFPELRNDKKFVDMSLLLDLAINVADNLADEFSHLSHQEKLYHLVALSVALENLDKHIIDLSRMGYNTEIIPKSLYSNLRKLLFSEVLYRSNSPNSPSDLELYIIRAHDMKPFIDLAKLFNPDIGKYEELFLLIRSYSLLVKDYGDVYHDEKKGIETPLTRAKKNNILEETYDKLKGDILKTIEYNLRNTDNNFRSRVYKLLKEIDLFYKGSTTLSKESVQSSHS